MCKRCTYLSKITGMPVDGFGERHIDENNGPALKNKARARLPLYLRKPYLAVQVWLPILLFIAIQIANATGHQGAGAILTLTWVIVFSLALYQAGRGEREAHASLVKTQGISWFLNHFDDLGIRVSDHEKFGAFIRKELT